MIKLLKISLGTLLCFSSIWVGSYVICASSFNDWWLFPTWFTSSFFFFIGLDIIYIAIND